jgi:hypothetical protein
VSISSTFYARVFEKFWRQKLQSFVLALRLNGAKISYKKRARKMLMKLTTQFWVQVMLEIHSNKA